MTQPVLVRRLRWKSISLSSSLNVELSTGLLMESNRRSSLLMCQTRFNLLFVLVSSLLFITILPINPLLISFFLSLFLHSSPFAAVTSQVGLEQYEESVEFISLRKMDRPSTVSLQGEKAIMWNDQPQNESEDSDGYIDFSTD